jgi:CheY-like chemotaxis protein
MVKQPTSGSRLLIVEDNAETRQTLAEILVAVGYQVACVADGQEAMEHLLAAVPPQLILLDLLMPRMNGWVFRSQQLQNPKLAAIPVVVVSGADPLPVAADLRAAAVLPKPLDVDQLLDTVATHCH